MIIPLNEIVFFDLITFTPSTLAAVDADSTPTFSVYDQDNDTAILGPTNMTKRTALTGDYRGSFTASVANGFTVGNWYSVVCSATVSAVVRKVVVLHFRLNAVEAQTGYPASDATFIAGYPQTQRDLGQGVLVTAGTGTGQLDISGGRIGIDWAKVSNPGTTVLLTSTAIATLNGNVGGNVVGNVNGSVIGSVASVSGSVASVTGSVGSVAGNIGNIPLSALSNLGVLGGTATGGSTTTLQDTTNRTETSAMHWVGAQIVMTGGGLKGQSGRVNAFNPATDTLTFEPAMTAAVGVGDTYLLLPSGIDAAILDRIDDGVLVSLGNLENDVNSIDGRVPAALSGGFMKASIFGGDATAWAALVTTLQTQVMTESYAANGATMSLAQGVYMLFAALTEFSIAAGVVTAKKLDGSAAMTFQWDSATTPTSSERLT